MKRSARGSLQRVLAAEPRIRLLLAAAYLSSMSSLGVMTGGLLQQIAGL